MTNELGLENSDFSASSSRPFRSSSCSKSSSSSPFHELFGAEGTWQRQRGTKHKTKAGKRNSSRKKKKKSPSSLKQPRRLCPTSTMISLKRRAGVEPFTLSLVLVRMINKTQNTTFFFSHQLFFFFFLFCDDGKQKSSSPKG